jgi:hypothetical protein
MDDKRDLSSRPVGGIEGAIGADAPLTASPGLRAGFFAVAAATLGLWAMSLIPPYQSWGNPNEDGFSYVPLFWATLTVLPCGLFLLAGGIIGRGKAIGRARTALFIGCGLSFIVVAFWIFQYFANR